MSDKCIVREWMSKYCRGFEHAKNKNTILSFISARIPNLNERILREILSELKHEGFIGSLSSLGYWYIPDPCNDRDEIEMAKRSWTEMRSRAMSMLTDCDKQIKSLEDRLRVATQGQEVLF